MSSLPCNIFLYQHYHWHIPFDGPIGCKYELKGLVALIQKCKAGHGVLHPDETYEDLLFDEYSVMPHCLEQVIRRYKRPGDFMEYFLGYIPLKQRSIGMNLELVRHVHCWFMTDVEE